MNFIDIVWVLEQVLTRECTMFKSSNLMQKTINYNNIPNLPININGESFENINQILFLTENNELSLYLIQYLGNQNISFKIFPIRCIQSLNLGGGLQ